MLTDTQCKNAPIKAKPYKLTDAHALYLYVAPTGLKSFRLHILIDGKYKTVTLGKYPATALKVAREKAQDVRQKISMGIAVTKPTPTNLQTIALGYLDKQKDSWSARHFEKQRRRLEMFIYPALGAKDIKNIKAIDILTCLNPIDGKGTGEVAHRTLNLMSQILRYAVARSLIETDCTTNLRGALKPERSGHYKALIERTYWVSI